MDMALIVCLFFNELLKVFFVGGLPLRLASANNVPFFEGCIADVKLSAIKRAQLESFVSSRVDDDTKRLDFGRSKHKNLGSCSGGDD